MRLRLLAVGRRMPAWVNEGVNEYTRRLPREWQFALHELPQAPSGSAIERVRREAQALLGKVEPQEHLVLLDPGGRQHSTEELARRLTRWEEAAKPVVCAIGGADGLDAACHDRADECWSLSRLTFPHPLARILVVEQLYRARSLIDGHPYHRA